jgi:hypothetical protein
MTCKNQDKRKKLAIATTVYADQWQAIPGNKAKFTRDALDAHLEKYGIFIARDPVKELEASDELQP